jgi:signal transduction histidine kinase
MVSAWALVASVPIVLVLAVLYIWTKHRMSEIQDQFVTRYSERLKEAQDLHDTLIQGFQGLTLRMQAAMENVSGNDETKLKMESILSSADDLLVEGRERAKEFSEKITYKREDKRVVLE